ncbi:hypothetical protein BU090_09190 [Staphylococcus warneri]|uniref:hypothetical protein n=1 Tax=Staphylococcus warneri TaxID=1292 RepID=UPI000D1D3C4A|nr:hypothetical protein [Staphylococcus warneri]PTI59904.1 hypothetical protein BU090_09190 [Staphylococcus warneri]
MKLSSLVILSSTMVLIAIGLITYNQSANPNIYIVAILSIVLGIISTSLFANTLKLKTKKKER